MSIDTMRGDVEFLTDALRSIHEEAGDRPLTDEEQARFDDGAWLRNALIAEGIEVADREARRAEVARSLTNGTATIVPGTPEPFQVRTDPGDPFDYRAAVLGATSDEAAAGELRGRALKAIESAPHMTDAQRETATVLAESDYRGDKTKYLLDHGSDAYHEAFRAVMRHPQNPALAMQSLSPEAQRAALSLTGANGGYLVPFTLDPSVILTNDGTTNPFRAIARQETITTDDWNGVSSAGVTAEWIAEATQVADGSPTFAQPSITVHKADAYIQASLEVVADSSVSGEIVRLIQDAKDRLESTAFAVGSGSGQPFGIVSALQLTTASRVAGSSGAAGAADLVAADIYALDNDLGPRYRQNASFVANKKTWNSVRQLGTSNVYHAFWTDFGGGLPANLIGYPVYESSAMDSTIVSGSNDDVIVLGDFQNYVIVDRMGLELVYEPLVKGANQRPTGEVGWVAFWRVGGDSVNDAAFRMLRL